jgi:diaminopimelate dehydrogenase
MFYSITGTLATTEIAAAVIDVNGVAFYCNISAKTHAKLSPKLGEKVTLFTHLNVKEDALDLYGFISQEELDRDHKGIPHGGFVIRSGNTGWNGEHKNIIEYSLKLDSNPEFTSSVLVAYARAAYRMNKEGQKGCKTVFDVAPAYLCRQSNEELRAHML